MEVEFPLRQLNDRAVMEREIVAILEASATGSMTRDSLMAVVALRSESQAYRAGLRKAIAGLEDARAAVAQVAERLERWWG